MQQQNDNKTKQNKQTNPNFCTEKQHQQTSYIPPIQWESVQLNI